MRTTTSREAANDKRRPDGQCRDNCNRYQGIEKRLGNLDDQLAEGTAEIRSKILDQSKALTAEIATKHRELVSLLDREVQALRIDKTDREALADLFAEFGMRLKNEFNLPDK